MDEGLEERYIAMRQNAAVSGGVMELIIDLYKYGKQCDETIASLTKGKESEVERDGDTAPRTHAAIDYTAVGVNRPAERSTDAKTEDP